MANASEEVGDDALELGRAQQPEKTLAERNPRPRRAAPDDERARVAVGEQEEPRSLDASFRRQVLGRGVERRRFGEGRARALSEARTTRGPYQ